MEACLSAASPFPRPPVLEAPQEPTRNPVFRRRDASVALCCCYSVTKSCLVSTPWTAALQAPPSMGFSRQEYWSGVPLPSPFSNHRNSFFFFFCQIYVSECFFLSKCKDTESEEYGFKHWYCYLGVK